MLKPTGMSSPATAIALIMALGLLAGCNKFKSPEQFLQSAEAHRSKGEIFAAIIDVKNALQKDPKNQPARLLLARYYLDLPDPRGAEGVLLRVRQDGASAKDTAALMSETDLMLAKPDAALQETLIADDANSGLSASQKADLLAIRSEGYMATGRRQESHAAIEASRQLDPHSIDMFRASIALAMGEHDYVSAASFIAAAKKIDPDNVNILSEEGAVDYASGDLVGSEAAFKRVRALAHWNVMAQIGLARTLIAENKLKEADGQLIVALKAAPDDLNANYLQSVSALRQNDFKKAADHVARVLDKSQSFAPALLVAGAAAFGTHQLEQASNYLNQYIYQMPDDVHARQLLSSVEVALGRPNDAVKTLAPVADKSNDAGLLGMIAAASARSGDLGSANRYLARAVEREPNNAALRTQFGLTQVSLGNTAAGVQELERASQQDPTSSRPEIALVLTYIRDKQYDKALAVAQKLQKSAPDQPIGYDLAGSVDLARNDPVSAREAFLKARELKATDTIALRSLAVLALKDNRLDEAAGYYQELIKANPQDTQNYIDLSNVQARQNHVTEMQATLRDAIDKNPSNDLTPRLILARYMLLSRQYQSAADMLEPALVKSPKDPALLEAFGRSQLALGNNDAALRNFKLLVEVAPQTAASHRYLAQAYAGVRDLDGAMAESKKAVELDPKNIQGRMTLTQLYAAGHDYANAEKMANALAVDNPTDPSIADLQGIVAAAQGHMEASLAAYKRAVSINDNSATRADLARAQARAGHPEDARKTLQALIDKNPKDTMPRLVLGDLDLTLKDYDGAAIQYAAIVAEAPNNPAAENNLAWALSQKRDTKQALEHARHAADLAAGNSPEVLDTLGVIQLQNKNAADAVATLEKATSLAPQQAQIQYHYGQALAAAGNKDKARIALDAALATPQKFDGRDQAQKLRQDLGS